MLQHTASCCNTLHHAATHCITLHHTASCCNTLQHTATHYKTLQHTATHYTYKILHPLVFSPTWYVFVIVFYCFLLFLNVYQDASTHLGIAGKESCHTFEWVMSHVWMSHVKRVNESCHTYKWVMSHIWMSHVTHMNESCHTHEWVKSHIWMSHSCLMNICVVWLVQMCDMTHSYVWHDSFICVTWLIHTCDMTHSYVWHESLMTDSYVWVMSHKQRVQRYQSQWST